MSARPFGIEKIETYLPPKTVTAEELANQFGFDPEFILSKIGVKQLHQVEEETTSDMAVRVMNKLLEDYPVLRTTLDVLVVCTQTPDFQLPQISALVQSRCNLSKQVASFDIGLGCSGFVYGINVLESLLAHNGMSTGVLITAESYSSVINSADRNTKCLFSDGAAATLITLQGNVRLGEFRFGTDGDYFDALIIRPRDDDSGKHELFMDGRRIFEFVASTIPSEVHSACTANQTTLEQLDFFVFHQASKFLMDTIAKKLHLQDSEKMVNVLHRYGNTVSSSIPMALKDTLALHGNRDLKILASGFGVGLSWATTVLTTEGDCSNV
ncbi:MAG: hypothetical protein A3F67_00925 [Verrucomicrobia bacterium RIFCSPHIGHO2_12_FULL_41_10]|nr:MAG: hypothetical protein A3F67_00925 [Verrucomicrobia bacterium RIFCSPHIGHO2_12_FULL_41_10]